MTRRLPSWPLILLGALLVACTGSEPATQAPGTVVDNADPEMVLEGDWRIAEVDGSYGKDCAQAEVNPIVPNEHGYTMYYGGSHAYVRPQLPAAGTYEIFAWWCRPPQGAAHNLEIEVHPTAGFVAYQTAHVDLTQDYGGWVSLGAFYLERDGSLILSNLEGPADGGVVVDAFRFLYRSAENIFQAPTPPVSPPVPSPTPSARTTPPPLPTRTP